MKRYLNEREAQYKTSFRLSLLTTLLIYSRIPTKPPGFLPQPHD